MKALKFILAGGAAVAALAAASPASAQYYPGYPGYGYGGNPVGQVISQIFGGGYNQAYGYNQGYGYNQQAMVGQCVNAVQARLGGNVGYNPYGYANGYAGGRVLGVSRVEPRSNGGFTVRGVASSGVAAGYGYAGNSPDLTWKCRIDYRGYISDIDVDRAQSNYGYNYTPYNNDPYAAYGYRRY